MKLIMMGMKLKSPKMKLKPPLKKVSKQGSLETLQKEKVHFEARIIGPISMIVTLLYLFLEVNEMRLKAKSFILGDFRMKPPLKRNL